MTVVSETAAATGIVDAMATNEEEEVIVTGEIEMEVAGTEVVGTMSAIGTMTEAIGETNAMGAAVDADFCKEDLIGRRIILRRRIWASCSLFKKNVRFYLTPSLSRLNRSDINGLDQ